MGVYAYIGTGLNENNTMYHVIDAEHSIRCIAHCIYIAMQFAALVGGRVEQVL